MVFVQEVNPFTGIICSPYYLVWVVMIISWLLPFLEMLYVKQLKKCDSQLWSSVNANDNKVTKELKAEYYAALESWVYGIDKLPHEIIKIIINMLPLTLGQDAQNYWWAVSVTNESRNKIRQKSQLLHATKLIYPLIKLVMNVANFIIILNRYGIWYNEHQYESNWRKYCAFIITMFYLPNFRLTSLWNILYIEDLAWIAKINIMIDIAFIIWFIIVSFPILMSGLFIFIPTTIFSCCIGLFIYFGIAIFYEFSLLYCCIQIIQCFCCCCCCDDEDINCDIYDIDMEYTLPERIRFSLFLTLGTMCMLIMITMSTMEFYYNKDWIESYRIGFFGEYCNSNDYVSFNKFNQYSTDIQFLIISWILF